MAIVRNTLVVIDPYPRAVRIQQIGVVINAVSVRSFICLGIPLAAGRMLHIDLRIAAKNIPKKFESSNDILPYAGCVARSMHRDFVAAVCQIPVKFTFAVVRDGHAFGGKKLAVALALLPLPPNVAVI